MLRVSRVPRRRSVLPGLVLSAALAALVPVSGVTAAEADASAQAAASEAPAASQSPAAPASASGSPASPTPPASPLSTDAGAAWPSSELPGAAAIAASEDAFVVVGHDGQLPSHARAWTSNDGLVWGSAVIIPEEEGSSMAVVTSTDAGFVALGTGTSDESEGPDRVAAWHSADGQSWERATLERPRREGLGAAVLDVVDGPGGLLGLGVFFGQDAGLYRLWRSADGSSWAHADLPGGRGIMFSSLVALPDGYLLVGRTRAGQASVWRSADGVAWEAVADAPRLIEAAASADGTVVGITNHAIRTTRDLADWKRTWVAPDPGAAPEEDTLLWVTFDGTGFDVSGVDFEGCAENVDECGSNFLLRSSDGTTWEASAGPDGIAGPDAGTFFTGVASTGDATVILGGTGPGPTLAWLAEAAGITE